MGIRETTRPSPDRVRQVHRELAAVEAVEESGDGLVEATVGVRGELRALRIDPRAYRHQEADALAESIMDAVRAAVGTAGRRGFAVAAELLPPGAMPEKADLAFDPVLYEIDRLTGRRTHDG